MIDDLTPKLKLNLGCGLHILENFENLDPKTKNNPSKIKKWSWNNKLPYDDETVELVVIQHVLMYCPKENYDWNFQEIYRVLCKGGKILLKEDNNKTYQWKKIGTKHVTGLICSSTNLEEIIPILQRNKFKNFVVDPQILIAKYNTNNQAIINRLPKLLKNKIFIIESTK